MTGDYVGHTPFGDIHGPEGAKRFFSMLREGFPNMQVTVEDQIAEGDEVVTRWTFRAGLFFLYALSSSLLGGIGRDTEYVVKHITSRSG